MPTSSVIEIPVETKDPCEAVKECLRLVRDHTAGLEGAVIKLSLFCSSDCGVLVSLAEQLPASTLGFRLKLSDRALNAGQFLASNAGGLSGFNGTLTDEFLPADALILIERLLASPPRAIRSTAFTVHIQNIRWKGAPVSAVGELSLIDLKAFNRVARFSLSVSIQLPFENSEAPEVQDALQKVSEATGVSFNKGRVAKALGDKAYAPERAQMVLAGQICLEEIFGNFSTKQTSHWISELTPNALSPRAALNQKMLQWGTTPHVKVNLPGLVKKEVKRTLPAFKFAREDGNEIRFTKHLGPDTGILLSFQKQRPRLGKAFTLSLGVYEMTQLIRLGENVFQWAGTIEQRQWIYNGPEEADAMVKESVNLARELLPRFEAEARRYFESWPKEIPTGIERHGPLTAGEAFAKAQALACSRFPDATLIRVRNIAVSVSVRDIEGPELSLDGRLVAHAKWWFHFYSADTDVSFQVTVPMFGRIQILDHGQQYQGPDALRTLVPMDDGWMDSGKALAIAEERGGQDRRQSGKLFGLLAKMEMSATHRPCWAFFYLMTDERGRNDLIVNLDAVTGEPMDDIRGF